MTPVVLGRAGPAAFGRDAQLHKPDRQWAQTARRHGGKRYAVIGVNHCRHAEFPKGCFKYRLRMREIGALHNLATQKVTAGAVSDR